MPDKASGTVIRIPGEQPGGIAASFEHLVLTCVLLSLYEKAARRLDLGLLLGRRYEYLRPARCTLVLVHPLSVFGKFTPAYDGSLGLGQRAVSSWCQGSCSFACLVTELQGWPIRLWTGLSAPSDYLEIKCPKRGSKRALHNICDTAVYISPPLF